MRRSMAAGSADIVVAGGMESMSNAPYLLKKHRTGAVVLTIEVNEQHASDSPVAHPGRDKELEGHAAALEKA